MGLLLLGPAPTRSTTAAKLLADTVGVVAHAIPIFIYKTGAASLVKAGFVNVLGHFGAHQG